MFWRRGARKEEEPEIALVAADLTVNKVIHLGKGYRLVVGSWTPSGTYTSGGEDMTTAIAAAKLGLSSIDFINFTPLTATSGGATYANVAFDHTPATNSLGKIHVQGSLAAHTHSFLVKGGQAAAGTDAISIKGSTPVTIGKEAATDATNVGGVGGGVQANTAGTTQAEMAAATSLTAYSCRFVAYGQRA